MRKVTPHSHLQPAHSHSTGIRLLYLVREKFPSFRPDVTEIFGRELPLHGVRSLLVMTSNDAASSTEVKRMGRSAVIVTPSFKGRKLPGFLHKLLSRLYRYCVFVRLGWFRKWDVIQSRDEIWGALLVALAAFGSSAKRTYWSSFPFPEKWFDSASMAAGARAAGLTVMGHVGTVVLYRIGMRLMDHVFVQSEQMRSDLASFGVPVHRMTPVPMGVQLRGLPEHPTQPPLPTQLVIGYLGTLDAERRPTFMVDVLARVRRCVPNAELLLVGNGVVASDNRAIERHARERSLEQAVRITGFLPRAEAWEALSRCFVCLSPFFPTKILNSTSPTKLVEYLQLSLPVVANDHPEQRQIIERSGVGRCVAWSEGDFATEILQMWDQRIGTWQQAKRGPHYVRENRSYEAIGTAVAKKYRELIDTA